LAVLAGLSISMAGASPTDLTRGRLAVQVWINYRCNGFPTRGADFGLPGAKVTVTNGDGMAQTETTSQTGFAYFYRDMVIRTGQRMTVQLELPPGYRGRQVILCSISQPPVRTLTERDFYPFSYARIDFYAYLGGEYVPPRPGLAILAPADGETLTGNMLQVITEVLNFRLGIDGQLGVYLDGTRRFNTSSDTFFLTDLPSGLHVIEVRVLNMAGTDLTPPVRAQASITVPSLGESYVYLVHMAPLAPDSATTRVDFWLGSQRLATDLRYGASRAYQTVQAGRGRLRVTPAGGSVTMADREVELRANQYYSVVLIGNGSDRPVELMLLRDGNPDPPDGRGALRLVHSAPLDSGSARVDVRRTDGTVLADDLAYKQAGDFVYYLAERMDLEVAAASGTPVLFSIPPFDLNDGAVLTLFIGGDIARMPLEGHRIAYQLGTPPAPPARLWFAHAAPFSGEPGMDAVHVALDGLPFLSQQTYASHSRSYLRVPRGEHSALVTSAADGATLVSTSLTLQSDREYTLVLLGNGNAAPLELLLLNDENLVPPVDRARLRVVQAAPFAAPLSLSRLDLRLPDGSVLVDDLAYRQQSAYLDLPTGTYALTATDTDGLVRRLDLPELTLDGEDIYTVLILGDTVRQPLASLAISQGFVTGQPFARFSPIADPAGLTASGRGGGSSVRISHTCIECG
jgi:hypothetical protein